LTTPSNSQPDNSVWADENMAMTLRSRIKTFYNADYFERIVMPLLDLPSSGRILDVGCGYGGLSFILAKLRPDLHITGVDMEAGALESAAHTAAENGWTNLTFVQGDGHQLKYEDNLFDAVLCQTVLTHVQDAERVIKEMARVLKPNGVFMAAEYTDMSEPMFYSSEENEKRDEAWIQKYFRLARLLIQGKRNIGRGDDELGIRVPYLATVAGLDVFDVRLNDRVLHVIPPYRHPKQEDYLEFLKVYFEPDEDNSSLTRIIDIMKAAGGTEEEARWLTNAESETLVRQAMEKRTLTRISAYLLFLTFARKPPA
jgi:ubiquinone/menaquinone biosynthesis C-methylase UbiE